MAVAHRQFCPGRQLAGSPARAQDDPVASSVGPRSHAMRWASTKRVAPACSWIVTPRRSRLARRAEWAPTSPTTSRTRAGGAGSPATPARRRRHRTHRAGAPRAAGGRRGPGSDRHRPVIRQPCRRSRERSPGARAEVGAQRGDHAGGPAPTTITSYRVKSPGSVRGRSLAPGRPVAPSPFNRSAQDARPLGWPPSRTGGRSLVALFGRAAGQVVRKFGPAAPACPGAHARARTVRPLARVSRRVSISISKTVK